MIMKAVPLAIAVSLLLATVVTVVDSFTLLHTSVVALDTSLRRATAVSCVRPSKWKMGRNSSASSHLLSHALTRIHPT